MAIKKFELPEWTKNLPDHTSLSGEDVKAIFGYQKGTSLSNVLAKGKIPKPDMVHRGSFTQGNKRKKYFWTLGYLRQQEQQQ